MIELAYNQDKDNGNNPIAQSNILDINDLNNEINEILTWENF